MTSNLNENQPLIQDNSQSSTEYIETDSGCSRLCNPHKWYYRYFALIYICLLGFGSYFCYDNPAALQDHFKKDLSISTATFTGILFSDL